MFHQLLLTQNVQISIVFLSVKSIIIKIKEWNPHHHNHCEGLHCGQLQDIEVHQHVRSYHLRHEHCFTCRRLGPRKIDSGGIQEEAPESKQRNELEHFH